CQFGQAGQGQQVAQGIVIQCQGSEVWQPLERSQTGDEIAGERKDNQIRGIFQSGQVADVLAVGVELRQEKEVQVAQLTRGAIQRAADDSQQVCVGNGYGHGRHGDELNINR